MDDMYYIGLDVHKKTISYCVKEAAGHVHREGKIGSTRRELDVWIQTLPQLAKASRKEGLFKRHVDLSSIGKKPINPLSLFR